MKKNRIGIIFLFIGFVFLLAPASFSITGNVIGGDFELYLNPAYILSLIFFIFSFIVFASRQSLDAIVIPTGGGEWDPETDMYSQDRDRTQKALRRKNRLGKEGYFVVSGHRDPDSKGGQSQSIYKYLREHGIKPSEMMIEGKSHDTLENVIYALKKIREREIKRHGRIRRPLKVAFVSYPEHLDRFEDFEKEAIKKGLIRKDDFEFHRIRTFPKGEERKEKRKKERDYEGNTLRKLKHRYKLVTMGRYQEKSWETKRTKPNQIINFINLIPKKTNKKL